MYCYRHPNVETALSCGRCDKPICTQCVIQTEVGGRCSECTQSVRNDKVTPGGGRLRTSQPVNPGRLLRQGLVTGFVLGLPGLLAVAVLSDRLKRRRRLKGALVGFCASFIVLLALGIIGVQF